MSYGIVTPARNEAEYIRNTLESVIGQTLVPTQWIIVNDNSSDETELIVSEYLKNYSWIKLVNYPQSNENRLGGVKVVNVVKFGLASMPLNHLDFIVKLDADLTIPKSYFKEIADTFSFNKLAGIVGGYCVIEKEGTYIKEKTASYHVRGAFKSYRKECYEMIGGIPQVYNWDGLDELKAMSFGWEVKVLPLEVIHHRPTGNETNKGIRSSFKAGKEYYRDGNDAVIAALRSCAVALRTSPKLFSGVIFFCGYIDSLIKRDKKNVDKSLEKFIRKFQYSRINNYLKRFIKLKS